MQIRKATMNDLPDILAIYAYAREYMKEHGNPDQWKDNYPPLELTTQDIRSGCLHVCIIRAAVCVDIVDLAVYSIFIRKKIPII